MSPAKLLALLTALNELLVSVEAGQEARGAADALFVAMGEGGFDLDLEAIDRLNSPNGILPIRCAE